MHFTNKSKDARYSKGVRVFSVVLSIMLICSMMFVGEITASAASISADTKMTLVFDSTASWWKNDGAETYIIWWNNESDKYLKKVNDDYTFTFPDDCNNFIILRLNPNNPYSKTDKVSVGSWIDESYKWYQSAAFTSVDGIKLKFSGSGSSSLSFTWVNVSGGGTTYSDVATSYGTYDSSTGYYDHGDVKLFPVDVEFYDYLTDYELDNGWRSVSTNLNSKEDGNYYASRSYKNRDPYTRWNKYISDLVGSAEADWTYPLYFGNLNTDWTDFSQYPYGSLNNYYLYNNEHTSKLNESAVLRTDSANYTCGEFFYNFSIYANDSTPISHACKIGNDLKYSGSVQGLVKSGLEGGTSSGALLMTAKNDTRIEAPYFSDTTVEKGYANKITSQFPMRVKSDNNTTSTSATGSKAVTYTTYEFDSGAKDNSVTSDNIYFTYSGGTPTSLNYGKGTDYELIDAYKSLGDKDEDHRGFFPFDNSTTTGGVSSCAYDYGFGMRLSIPFNVTEDGYILGIDSNGKYYKTNEPMKFTFEGDDDVWVFIDGKLALDLGGDHGNAKGYINFATQTSVVETGAVTLDPSPSYGKSEFKSADNQSKETTFNIIEKNSKNKYDPTKPHTLTVFYMERGLVESNLRMSFSVSPVANRLTLKKSVDTEGVNEDLKASLGIDSQSFSFKIDPYTKAGTTVEYTKNGSEQSTTLPADSTVTLKDGEYAAFENQFKLGENIGITETVKGDGYSYSTSYTLTDDYRSEYESNYKPTSGDGSEIPTFIYKTASTVNRAPTTYTAAFVNKVDTAKVTVSKAYSGTSGATEFTYGVVVKLPNNTSVTMSDITVKVNDSTEITGIPKGSTVTLTEKNSTDYTVKYKIDSGSETTGTSATIENIQNDTTVAFTNTDITNTTAKYTPAAKKYISGTAAGSDKTFNFTITPWNVTDDTANGTAVTKQNVAENITFDELTFSSVGTFWYKIEESANDDYTIDTSSPYSKAYYLKCEVTLSNHVYSVTPTYYKSDRSTTVTAENVIFNNIPVVRKGYLKVTKTGYGDPETDFNGTQFTYYKVSGENEKPAAGAQGTVLTVDKTKAEGKTEYDDVNSNYYASVLSGELDTGWYAVVETKAPDGYELYGEWKWVEVTAENTQAKPATVTFNNNKSTHLPTTGGIGVVVFITVGVVLIGAAILLLRPNKQAKK